jgi:uncharacterized OB-fold protein
MSNRYTRGANGKNYVYIDEFTKPEVEARTIDGRECLKCGTMFQSYGPHNRMCSTCKEKTSKFAEITADICIPKRR